MQQPFTSLDPNQKYFILDGKIGSLKFCEVKNKFIEDDSYNEPSEQIGDGQRSNIDGQRYGSTARKRQHHLEPIN